MNNSTDRRTRRWTNQATNSLQIQERTKYQKVMKENEVTFRVRIFFSLSKSFQLVSFLLQQRIYQQNILSFQHTSTQMQTVLLIVYCGLVY